VVGFVFMRFAGLVYSVAAKMFSRSIYLQTNFINSMLSIGICTDSDAIKCVTVQSSEMFIHVNFDMLYARLVN
jgi:hypothetical protein